jgi:TRAP-type C4-dicarboxylate transport system permease small subunit
LLERLRWVDKGLARGEAAMAAIALLVMIVVAAAQALLRNLTNLDVGWANVLLTEMEGADSFLQKGTLWLAFLGASLATHEDRHIAIDILPRIAPPRIQALMRGLVGLIAGTVSFFLAQTFWIAVLNNALDRPFEYEVLGAEGAMHICDASAAILADAGLDRPPLFCGIRWVLDQAGAPVETPGAAAQLIVPVMFLAISLRLLLKGVGAFAAMARGDGMGGPGGGLESATTSDPTADE